MSQALKVPHDARPASSKGNVAAVRFFDEMAGRKNPIKLIECRGIEFRIETRFHILVLFKLAGAQDHEVTAGLESGKAIAMCIRRRFLCWAMDSSSDSNANFS